MKTCRCIPKKDVSRMPVVIRKCRQLTTIFDNRPETVMQTRMLEAIQKKEQGGKVIQCTLKVGKVIYDEFEDVYNMLRLSQYGWDNEWKPSLASLLDNNLEFNNLRELVDSLYSPTVEKLEADIIETLSFKTEFGWKEIWRPYLHELLLQKKIIPNSEELVKYLKKCANNDGWADTDELESSVQEYKYSKLKKIFKANGFGWDYRWEKHMHALFQKELVYDIDGVWDWYEYLNDCLKKEYMDMLVYAGVKWKPKWELALNIVLQHPAYVCENGKELAELLKIMTNNYYESPYEFDWKDKAYQGICPDSWGKVKKSEELKKGKVSNQKQATTASSLYSTLEAYQDRSMHRMDHCKKKGGPLKIPRDTDHVLLFHGARREVAKKIQASGFLSPASPLFRNSLDASKDGFLSFAPTIGGATEGIIFCMSVTQEDLERWQFLVIRENVEVVTLLGVPFSRLIWTSDKGKTWNPPGKPI